MSAKFPRIYHLPFSAGGTSEDKRMPDLKTLLYTSLVVTEKLDGANVCLTADNVYARSHSSTPTHESFNWLKKYHADIKEKIFTLVSYPISIFCEYLYAVHSIEYPRLPSYLFVIGIRSDEGKTWVSWDLTCELASKLGLATVPFLGEVYAKDITLLEEFLKTYVNGKSEFGPKREGFVVRNTKSFPDEQFRYFVAKWVRKDHVQTDDHWTKNWKKAELK